MGKYYNYEEVIFLIKVGREWQDYTCIASGDGEKIEKWGDIILRRPDPQIIWKKSDSDIWNKWDGFYHRSNKGGGNWEFRRKLPEYWTVNYKHLKFKVCPTSFKHTGIFPEQAVNWDYVMDKIRDMKKEKSDIRILNLFAYTGCATMAAASAGASEVVHVDASKGMVEWAKENMVLSGLGDKKIRFIVDDVIKFLEREKRRGRTYHGIIMDPPSYGRGPKGEVWRLEDNLGELLVKARDILDSEYSFLLINSYTTGVSPTSLNNILSMTFEGNVVETGEIGIPILEKNLILPCGIYGRVTKN